MFRAHFFAAPHRLMFAGGVIQTLAAMLYWGFDYSGLALPPLGLAGLLLVAAAAAWLVVFGLWARVHFPMYFQVRPDGQPG